MKQRFVIDQLNLQAHYNVQNKEDEFVVEAFISYEKVI